MKTAILSGRYELLHPGHICTIRREAKRFDRLIVFIVDNEESMSPSKWAKEMIDYCTADLLNVVVILDDVHFGYATKDDLAALPKHDVFLSANPKVSEHLRSLGENVESIATTQGYSSSIAKEGLFKEALKAWKERV